MKSILIFFAIGFISGIIASLMHINFAGSILQNLFFVLTFVSFFIAIYIAVKKIVSETI
jgi:putative effector of murein hydrolase LrgA (UPF0299 family)